MSVTSKTYKPAHGGYPGAMTYASALCKSGDTFCRAGGYAHLIKNHDKAVAHGRKRLEEAMSR